MSSTTDAAEPPPGLQVSLPARLAAALRARLADLWRRAWTPVEMSEEDEEWERGYWHTW